MTCAGLLGLALGQGVQAKPRDLMKDTQVQRGLAALAGKLLSLFDSGHGLPDAAHHSTHDPIDLCGLSRVMRRRGVGVWVSGDDDRRQAILLGLGSLLGSAYPFSLTRFHQQDPAIYIIAGIGMGEQGQVGRLFQRARIP